MKSGLAPAPPAIAVISSATTTEILIGDDSELAFIFQSPEDATYGEGRV
jgi:hypothetical protein